MALAQHRREGRPGDTHLRLVVAATVIDQARRQSGPAWRPPRRVV